MAFKWFTNAHVDHYGKSIAVNGDHVISIFSVDRERDGASEKITILFGGPEGSWEVQESDIDCVARLNSAE